MNRKLLALAVAAAMASPGIASAEAILYGRANASLDYADVTNLKFVDPETGEEVFWTNPATGQRQYAPYSLVENEDGTVTLRRNLGVDFNGWGMSRSGYIPGEGRGSRLGVRGSEDLGNGLKAVYQVELGINLNDTNRNVLSNSDSIAYRNSFVGLAGNWGTFLGGRHDTPLRITTSSLDLFSDTMADYNGTVGFRDLRADNVVAYISPEWSGFQLLAAFIPSGGATGGGNGLNLEESDLASTYSIGAVYRNGPFHVSAGFENLYNEHFNTQAVALQGNNCPVQDPPAGERDPTDPFELSCDYQDSDAQAYRFGLGLLDWNGFTVTAVYENQDQFNNDRYVGSTDPADPANSFLLPYGPKEADLWQIQAGYAFGSSMVKAMYGQGDYSGNDIVAGGNWISINGGPEFLELTRKGYDYDTSTWAIGFDHNFSRRTTAYVLYTDVDSDLDEIATGSSWSGFSLGMMHRF
jgi:predicted porin